MSSDNNLVEVGFRLTPALVMKALTEEMERCWRIKSVFSPNLDYQESGENHNSDHLAENDISATGEGHPLIDSIFAWNRSPLTSNTEVGDFSGVLQRLCEDRGAIDFTSPGEVTVSFRGFFSDVETMETFEMGYLVEKIVRNITSVSVVVCDLDGEPTDIVETFSITWNPITSIDWSLRENNYMSLDFSARIEGNFRCSISIDDNENVCLPKPILKFFFNAYARF